MLSNFSCSELFLNAWRSCVFVRLCCSSHFGRGQTTVLVSRRTRCRLWFLRGEWKWQKWPLQLFLWGKGVHFQKQRILSIVQNLRCRRIELKWEDAPSGTGRRCLPDSQWMFYRPSPGNPFDCSRRSLRGLAFRSHMGSCEASFLLYLSVLPLCCSLSCLCVGLWSPKVLESEWASNSSRLGSSAGLFGSQPTVPSSMCLTDSFRRGSASVAVRHQAFIRLNFPSLSKTRNKTGDINDLDCQERAVPWKKCKHFLSCLSFYVFRAICSCCMLLYWSLFRWEHSRHLMLCFLSLKKRLCLFFNH